MSKILSVRNLHVSFTLRGRSLHALRGVDLEVEDGESLAIVGESGSGKSVLNKNFIGLLDPNGRITEGEIRYYGMGDKLRHYPGAGMDENGNLASYAQLPIRLRAEGAIALDGPELLCAEGGSTGCYVRTVGESGEGLLTLETGQTEPVTLRFTVD